jgi:hypothetical protein
MDIQKLESIQDLDQKAIHDFKAGLIDLATLDRINAEHKAFLLEMIAAFGFPFKDVSSPKAYEAAFLIIQHACDQALLERAIGIFSTATSDQIERRHLGYFVDRLRILRGLPQVYGTQYRVSSDQTVEFLPIENPDAVDARRAELGMGTIAEYRKYAESPV